MKFSKKLIFLAIILIVVSIISIYFGSITTVEGATTCPAGATSSTSTDANGNVTFSCSTDATTAAASCTGIVCAPKVSDCTSKKAYSNKSCCPTGKTACQPK